MEWVKFNYDDGAEVFYRINKKDELVEFKTELVNGESKIVSLFFDELEDVYLKTKNVK